MITSKKKSTHRIYQGKTYQVEFYRNRRGKMPGFNYYKTLSEDEKARFFALVSHIANAPIGTIHSKTIFNLEDSKHRLFALKSHQHRFFIFQTADRKLVVTNAYKKESQKMDRSGRAALHIAIQSKQDYETRRKQGAYNEKY